MTHSTGDEQTGYSLGDAQHKEPPPASADMTVEMADDISVDTSADLDSFCQGDLLGSVAAIAVTGNDGQHEWYATPDGVVLISQTCDIVQPNRTTVAVAPAVTLDNLHAARDARNGKRPSLVHLPDLGDNIFADLGVIGTISKGHLVSHAPVHGVSTDWDIRHLGQVIGRKWSRFAFPDDIVPWLDPLRSVLASKALRPNSAEGKVLADISELRVEARPGWTVPGPQELTVVVIVTAGGMPHFSNDDLPDLPAELDAWLYDGDGTLIRQPAEIADRLVRTDNATARHFLWDALGEAWVARCTPNGTQRASVHDAVNSIVAEVVAEDEYTLDRVRGSEQLDLDHLSEPLPRPLPPS